MGMGPAALALNVQAPTARAFELLAGRGNDKLTYCMSEIRQLSGNFQYKQIWYKNYTSVSQQDCSLATFMELDPSNGRHDQQR